MISFEYNVILHIQDTFYFRKHIYIVLVKTCLTQVCGLSSYNQKKKKLKQESKNQNATFFHTCYISFSHTQVPKDLLILFAVVLFWTTDLLVSPFCFKYFSVISPRDRYDGFSYHNLSNQNLFNLTSNFKHHRARRDYRQSLGHAWPYTQIKHI